MEIKQDHMEDMIWGGGKDCRTKQNENRKQLPLKFFKCLELSSITNDGA